MNITTKPRIIKAYNKLDSELQKQIKLNYPYGFDKHLITFKNIKGKFVSALPYETDNFYYLIRMTREQAIAIILEDRDYDSRGVLKDEVKESYEEENTPEEILDVVDSEMIAEEITQED